MAEGPEEGDGRDRRPTTGGSPVPVCRRLQLVAVLLGIVGVLGLATSGLVAVSPAGEGFDDLLPDDEADVMGQVRDDEGNLVEGATVTYSKGGISDTTGSGGWYFLEGVDTGNVVLTMEADGFKTVERTVQLERGKYTVDFLAEAGTGTVEVSGAAVPEPGDAGARTWLMAVGIAVASVFALLGAYSAYVHRWYPLVLVGCLFGLLTWGWFVGSALSVLSLIVVLPLRGHFGPKDIECELPWHEPPPPDLEVPDDEGTGEDAETPLEVASVDTPPPGGTGPGGIPPG